MVSGHKYVLGTCMILEDIKSKGKITKSISEEYTKIFTENIIRYIETKNINGLTLDCNCTIKIAIRMSSSNCSVFNIYNINIRRNGTNNI